MAHSEVVFLCYHALALASLTCWTLLTYRYSHNKPMKIPRIPTPIIDLAIVVTPYLIGYIELKATGSSAIFAAMDAMSFGEKFILYILTFLLVEFVDYKHSYNRDTEGAQSNIDKLTVELKNTRTRLVALTSKVELIHHGQQLDRALAEVKHPYFVNLIARRLKSLLAQNSALFVQTERTYPSHANTFGAQGIRTTRDNLKCVSYIPEYWEDKGETEYMDTQINLMKRGVKIKRLFIVNDKNRDNTRKQMAYQHGLGIDTKCIEQAMVDFEFREKDYLVQDDELLVELYFDEGMEYGTHKESKELITVDDLVVQERIEQFTTNWANAKSL